MLVVNSGKPRTLYVGDSTPDGVKLISARSDSAVLEIDGKRQAMAMGQTISSAEGFTWHETITLTADSAGHFSTVGTINGATVKFCSTGASMVSMSAADTVCAGVGYTSGERTYSSTANGVVAIYVVKLDVIKIGNTTLNNVLGSVHQDDILPVLLLGMSFLKRLEMKRDGDNMTLTKNTSVTYFSRNLDRQ